MGRTVTIHGQSINDWGYQCQYTTAFANALQADPGGLLTNGRMDGQANPDSQDWAIYFNGDVTVRIDLVVPRAIGWVALWTMRDVGRSREVPTRIQVYGSNDDATWTPLADLAINPSDYADKRPHRITAYSGATQTYQYVKLIFTPVNGKYIPLGEVPVWERQPTKSPTYSFSRAPDGNADESGMSLYDWVVDDASTIWNSDYQWVGWWTTGDVEIICDWGPGRQKTATSAGLRFLRHDSQGVNASGYTMEVYTSDDAAAWTLRGSMVIPTITTDRTAMWASVATDPVPARFLKYRLTGGTNRLYIDEADIIITDPDTPTSTGPVSTQRVIVMFI